MIFLQRFMKFDQSISEKCVGETFGRRKKEKKDKKITVRNLIGTTCTSSGTRSAKIGIRIGLTNIAAVAMETKKGGFKKT
jgi:hypothetical protein